MRPFLKSNIIVADCAVLIAVNIGVFIFVPKILAPLALILSNVITVILMFLAFQPMNHIMQTALKKKEEEIYQRKKEEEELREKLQSVHPRFLDSQPMTLEEIFIYEMGGADYAVRDILL